VACPATDDGVCVWHSAVLDADVTDCRPVASSYANRVRNTMALCDFDIIGANAR